MVLEWILSSELWISVILSAILIYLGGLIKNGLLKFSRKISKRQGVK